jgi:hypothetical protein
MPNQLAGFPFWILQFDENGNPADNVKTFLEQLPSANLTDLFIFSHGWNNDEDTAMKLYTGFFGEMRNIVDDPAVNKKPNAVIGVAGVIWPSILFPGDANAPASDGGAASFSASDDAGTLESELPKVFTEPEQQPILQELLAMVQNQPPGNDALLAFRDKLAQLVSPKQTESTQDDLELKASTVQNDDDWMALLDAMSQQATPDDSGGGAASFGSAFGRLWNGAKNVLRVATYWQMKNRAGVIGTKGLGPLIGKVHNQLPELKIHLLGHSFGARLVSYALAGLPQGLAGQSSPIKALFLLQGAFSHFAFADSLPFDPGRKGDLAGMAQRVDGPLLTTYSLKDLAVGNAYPAASVLAGQDAADATDLLYRWEGMGHDGAQAVNAANDTLGPVQTSYAFQTGAWLNLDGNQVIVNGSPPSGAHSDIIHPHTAWAALTAAKIALPKQGQTAAGAQG